MTIEAMADQFRAVLSDVVKEVAHYRISPRPKHIEWHSQEYLGVPFIAPVLQDVTLVGDKLDPFEVTVDSFLAGMVLTRWGFLGLYDDELSTEQKTWREVICAQLWVCITAYCRKNPDDGVLLECDRNLTFY